MAGNTSPSNLHQLLEDMAKDSKVTSDTIGRVLRRVMIVAPRPVSQSEIARGDMLAASGTTPTEIPPATVSRAVAALRKEQLVSDASTAGSAVTQGRPVLPLQLGSPRWAVAGVHIDHRHGHVTGLMAQLFTLDLATTLAEERVELGEAPVTGDDIARQVAALVTRLQASPSAQGRHTLGVGIEIGGHVHSGQIIDGDNMGWHGVDLGPPVAELTRLPTVVENDVNARAQRLAYSPDAVATGRNFALVVVFEEGVGGALMIDGRVYRGVRGAAGEIGHLTVEYDIRSPGNDVDRTGFAAPCVCGRPGHVDAIATPARLAAELGVKVEDLPTPSQAPLFAVGEDQQFVMTKEAAVFHRAGVALGRGLAALANLANPGPILLSLPPELGEPAAGTAASAYLAAVEATLNDAYSTTASDARASQRTLPVRILRPEDVSRDGAQAAAICVLHALVEEARGRGSLICEPAAMTSR